MRKQEKHDKGLYLFFFTDMWERFSYYGMRGILILYLSKTLMQGGLGISMEKASLIYGYFTGFVYFTPLLGGWLADNYIGQRKSITIGGIMMMMGQLTLFAFNTHWGLFLGLSLLVFGNGFFKPNISTVLGLLYEKQPERKDSAFSIFYMGINLGAFMAPLVIGYAAEDLFALKGSDNQILSFGYKYGFLIAAIGMFISQISYNLLAKKYLGETGMKAAGQLIRKTSEPKIPLTKKEKDRIKTIFIFSAISIFFWAAFEQAGSSLTLYTDRFIEKKVAIGHWSWMIPTSWFQSINALFIVMLAPVFAAFWQSRLGRSFSTPVKMGIAMILVGMGFLFMLGAVFERGGDHANASVKAGFLWIVFTYLFHTLGELCLSPVGLSVVTKLSPPKLASLLMGIWLLSSFIANIAGGYIASYVHKLGAKDIFMMVTFFCFLTGALTLVFSGKISRKMHGIR